MLGFFLFFCFKLKDHYMDFLKTPLFALIKCRSVIMSPKRGRKIHPILKILASLVRNLKPLPPLPLPSRKLKNIPRHIFKGKQHKMQRKLELYFIMVANGNTPSNYPFKSYIKRLQCADEYRFISHIEI